MKGDLSRLQLRANKLRQLYTHDNLFFNICQDIFISHSFCKGFCSRRIFRSGILTVGQIQDY